jgi:hypothetical protein
MNHLVVRDADSKLHIHVVPNDNNNLDVIEDGSLVQIITDHSNTKDHTIKVKLTLQAAENSNRKVPNFQYVLDIMHGNAIAQFASGACDDKRRISAKQGEIVELHILPPADNMNTNVTILAGWAAGHEEVKLTRPLTIVFAKDEPFPDSGDEMERHSTTKSDWVAFLLSNCKDERHSLSSASHWSTRGKLRLDALEHNSNGAVAHLEFMDSTIPYDQVILETSAHGLFSSMQDSACHGRRAAVSQDRVWPPLTIPRPDDVVTVWALYSRTDADVLYRTEPFVFKLSDADSLLLAQQRNNKVDVHQQTRRRQQRHDEPVGFSVGAAWYVGMIVLVVVPIVVVQLCQRVSGSRHRKGLRFD